ncbi:MAG: Rrf2 family transcriptional regulator [Bacteriovoracaceae bacterium]|nr:Rrf2 family transcriptional regulator [Bacteriovoracaceae bacterium]
MRLTSKGRYAFRAMLDLTFYSEGRPVRLQEISTRQNISLHYLEQLFRKLRTGRVVKSVRGPGGGYVLSRDMNEITVKDILESVGENINPARDILGSELAGAGDTVEFNVSKGYFQKLGNMMQDYLHNTSLGMLRRDWQAQNPNFIPNPVRPAPVVTPEQSYASVIRPPMGEINQ